MIEGSVKLRGGDMKVGQKVDLFVEIGEALGGGIYSDGDSTVTLTHSNINANRASGGTGIGGGVSIAGDFSLDKRTKIRGNKASTSHDNVFGDPALVDDLLTVL